MSQYNDMPTELTDAELAQIQGGGWIGDAWNAVKKGAKVVGGVLVDVAEAVIDYIKKHPPTYPNPGGPGPWGGGSY